MTRVLLVGSTADWAIETFYRNALERLGHDALVFDPDSGIPRALEGRVLGRLTWSMRYLFTGRALVELFERDPRWDAVIVFKGLSLSPQALARCRALTPKARWANFNPDNPFVSDRASSSRHVRAAISLYDHYFIWSRALLQPLRAAGARAASYLPFAFAEEHHFPAPVLDPQLSGAINLVGSFDSTRTRMLEPLADLPLRLYGGHWERLPRSSRLRRCVAGGVVFGAELRRVISSSLASINLMRAQNRGAHNMRTFEVPAMGGLLLTTRSAEQQAVFPEGEASLMFDSQRELRAQIEALLAGRVDAQALRARALTLSRGHSYTDRARELLATLLG
jgi:spore maturation protein CgeB